MKALLAAAWKTIAPDNPTPKLMGPDNGANSQRDLFRSALFGIVWPCLAVFLALFDRVFGLF